MAGDEKVEAEGKHGGKRAGAGRKSKESGNQGDNVTLNNGRGKRGNRAEYWVRRLKRDAPGIAKALARFNCYGGHGQFGGMVREDLPFSRQTAFTPLLGHPLRTHQAAPGY